MLEGVASGAVTKREVEVVIARHDEDIGWAAPFAPLITVYDKSKVPLPNSVVLRNIGREQHSYFKHIVDRYDDLADHTVFFHGASPSFGFFLRDKGVGKHLMTNVSAIDYVAVRPRVSNPAH